MNKYLLMSAAALVGSTSTASASSASINLGYCSNFHLGWQGDLYLAKGVGFPSCGSSVVYAIGLAGKTKGMGKNVNFGITYSNAPLGLDFALPLKTGKEWVAYASTNGSTMFILDSGTYTVANGARANSGSRTSLATKIHEMLQERADK